MAHCRHTSGILQRTLDRTDPDDHAHLARCATCRSETERIRVFDRAIEATAIEAAETVPDPAWLAGRPVLGGRLRRFNSGLAPLAALTAAIAAGVLLTTVIGLRPTPTAGDPALFAAPDRAIAALAPLGLVCEVAPADAAISCVATAPDHIHRAVLTTADGRVVDVEVRIETTDGGPLGLSGVPEYFSRVAGAVIDAERRGDARSWIRDAYQGCDSSCRIDIGGLGLRIERHPEFVSLSLRGL